MFLQKQLNLVVCALIKDKLDRDPYVLLGKIGKIVQVAELFDIFLRVRFFQDFLMILFEAYVLWMLK